MNVFQPTEAQQAAHNVEALVRVSAILGYRRDYRAARTDLSLPPTPMPDDVALLMIEHAIRRDCICEWEPDSGVLVIWQYECPANQRNGTWPP